jgi:hypothetical protein
MVSLSFCRDPLDHTAQEAIEQIEIVTASARVHRIGKMPADWSAEISGRQDAANECTLNCSHQSFAEPDVHVFDGVVSYVVPEGAVTPEAEVQIWITRGPTGTGRIVELSTNDFVIR